mmetsp:Transcript_76393/g.153382  ORF Transcript_76393/g.153382 Transcript_76393/m.153382 type:complete len:223 (-) Transcript_76393:1198-1866(-)
MMCTSPSRWGKTSMWCHARRRTWSKSEASIGDPSQRRHCWPKACSPTANRINLWTKNRRIELKHTNKLKVSRVSYCGNKPAVCTHCGPSRQKTPRSPPVRPRLPVLLVQQGPQGEPVREARLVQHVQVGVEGFELGDGVHARHGAKVDEHHGRATPPSALPSHTHAVCIGSGLRHRVVFGVKHGLTKEKKKKGQTRGMSKKVCRKRYNKRSHLNACRNIDLP